mmetsp:Transcript_17400/g.22932  ORF Transcript_17400/g.22932 Transcript_17400/m.22932 type:complete len:176 (-) Transcript_17400:692-1219(-)
MEESKSNTPTQEEPMVEPKPEPVGETLEKIVTEEPTPKRQKRVPSEKQLEALKKGRERRLQQIKEGTYRKRKKEVTIEEPEPVIEEKEHPPLPVDPPKLKGETKKERYYRKKTNAMRKKKQLEATNVSSDSSDVSEDSDSDMEDTPSENKNTEKRVMQYLQKKWAERKNNNIDFL